MAVHLYLLNFSLIINGALCKHVPFWVVNYIKLLIKLMFSYKTPSVVSMLILPNFSSFIGSCSPLQTGLASVCIETVFKGTNHVHIVKSNCQFSPLTFFTFVQHLTQTVIPPFLINFPPVSAS